MVGLRNVAILGTRGIPANHGGFETFAEELSQYLVGSGWRVSVYCQNEKTKGPRVSTSRWRGIDLIHIGTLLRGSIATVEFDFCSVLHAVKHSDLLLILGYNTAVFALLAKLAGKKTIINMDGIEWKRNKWSFAAKLWFRLNERLAFLFSDLLIADHPKIHSHLLEISSAAPIAMIAYGSHKVFFESDHGVLTEMGLAPEGYYLVVARLEPENSILEIVRGFKKATLPEKLIIVGSIEPENEYHKALLDEAPSNIEFVGAIYEKNKLSCLRYFAKAYVHGHQVGGTNPSLVEALGASNAIIAHDNQFNRWVAGPDADFFVDDNDLACTFRKFASDEYRQAQRNRSSRIHSARFRWESILSQYNDLLSDFF